MTWPGSDPALPPVLLLAHQDVVPVEGASESKWTHPAFDGVIANDRIYGRGALDDKASLIAILAAAEQLISAGAKPKRTIMLAFGHDEEVLGAGAVGMAKLIQERGIKPWFALDEGMAIVADFPLTGKPAALIGVAEKGYLTVMVKAVDKGGHSSMPPKETAAVKVAKALVAIQEGGFPGGLGDGPARGMIEGLSASAPFPANVAMANLWLTQPLIEGQFAATPAGAAMLHTTVAPTMLRGGVKDNVLPQEAFAVVNFRLHPRDSQERVIARLKALTAKIEGVSIIQSTKGAEPSPVSSTQSSAYALIAAAAKAQGPAGMPVLPGLVLGGTDARHYVGVATDVYRFFPAVLTQADIATIHGADEQISVENLVRMQAFYAQLMLGR
jgi:carboxypeptidase PM20D1